MLQALVSRITDFPVPEPKEFLKFATRGGANCLGRTDIACLKEGMAADLFALDTNKLDYVGAKHDPASLIPKMGIGEYVDLTMINGKFVWRNSEFVGLDEKKLTFDAVAHLNRVVYEI